MSLNRFTHSAHVGEEWPALEVQTTDTTVIADAGTEESRHTVGHGFEFVRIILNSPYQMSELVR